MLEMIIGFGTIMIGIITLLIVSAIVEINVSELMFGIAMTVVLIMATMGASIEVGRLVLSLF